MLKKKKKMATDRYLKDIITLDQMAKELQKINSQMTTEQRYKQILKTINACEAHKRDTCYFLPGLPSKTIAISRCGKIVASLTTSR